VVPLGSASVKWKTTTLLNGVPCVTVGGVRAPEVRAASATEKELVLPLVVAPPASLTVTENVAPESSSA
jgi:hypothetical protein